MKKFTLCLLCLLLSLGAMGCSQRENSNPPAPPVQEVPSEDSQPEEAGEELRGFTIPEMDEEQAKYNKEYVRPLIVCGLLMRSWDGDNIEELLPNEENDGSSLIFAYEDLVGQEEMAELWDQAGGPEIPAEPIDNYLMERFPFTIEQIHQCLTKYYQPETNTYYYEGGRGGGPIETAVTSVNTLEDGRVEIGYSLFTGSEDWQYRRDGVLTVQQEDGQMARYLSVEVSEAAEAY